MSNWIGAFVLLSLLLITCVAVLAQQAPKKPYPILGDCSYWGRRAWFFSRWCQDSMTILFEGYNKFSKQNLKWSTWVFDDLFHVLPPSMIDELKSFPIEKLNFSRIVDDQFHWHFFMTSTLTDRKYVAVVQRCLVSDLPDLTSLMVDVIDRALDRWLSPPQHSRGWRVVMLWDGLLSVCHDVVAEIMLGDIGASQEYVRHAKGFTETVAIWSGSMHIFPGFLRWIYYRLSPGGRQIRHHLSQCKRIVFPELDRLHAEERASLDAGSDKKFTVPKGFLKHSLSTGEYPDRDEIVHQMLILTFAAAPMWNMILNQVIQNHLAYPEYNGDLRSEIEAAFRVHGEWTKTAFLNMPKLDSYLRETLRCTPPIMYTTQRRVMQPIQLSDGTALTPGQKVMVPTFGILHDAEIYAHPERFEPFRFYDPAKHTSEPLMVTQTSKYPVFGYGNQTCPGRFFASLATKIAFAKVLLQYQAKCFPRRLGKPVDWPIAASLMPNLDTYVAFRKAAS